MAKKRTTTTHETTTTTVRRSLVDPSTNEGPQVGMNGGGTVSGIAESVKNTVIGFLTPSNEKTLPSIVESSESGFEDGNIIGDKKRFSTPNERFVPAREFFAEANNRERLSSDYFSGSDTPSRLRESTRRLSVRKPYNEYIAYSSDEEYDDWKEQPKSDYTYSASLTYRKRVTPDRKIGSPNMSRRTLKGGNIHYVGSSDFSSPLDSNNIEGGGGGSHSWDLRSRTVLKPMDALSDTSDGEEMVASQNYLNRSRRSTRSRSIDLPKTNGSLSRTVTSTTTAYTTTRTLHLGLDTESDVEDGGEKESVASTIRRATPLLTRGGTPLGRATTPLGSLNSVSRRSSATLEGAGKGYKLGEGTIAEDVEEEEEEDNRNTVLVWSKKTWQSITRITTIITASIAMVAASALTTSSKEELDPDEKMSSQSQSHSFTSRITRSKVVTTVTEKYEAMRERLKKNPILIWIPLLLIFLLLTLLAYWLLLESRGKTAGATDPTENGPSLFLAPFMFLYDCVSWVYSSISSFLVAAWVTTKGTCTWIGTSCYAGLAYAWVSTVGMFTWLGTSAISCFNYFVNLLYIALAYLQYFGLAILSFFTSSASYLYGLLPFVATSSSVHDNEKVENESWSLVAWVSNLSPIERLSEMYVVMSDGVQHSGTMLWNGWLWLVLGMGEILSGLAAYTMWLLSSIWYAFTYLVVGLWTILTYLILAIIGFLTATATTVSSLASNTSSAIVTSTQTYVMPIFQLSNKVDKRPIITPASRIEKVEDIVQHSMHLKGGSVEEVVRQVLDSEELKNLISAAVAESSRGQLTIDAVSGIAKSVVERELGVIKEETSALRSEIQANTAASVEHQSKILQLREEKASLIEELRMLGQRLYNVEETVEAAGKRSVDDRQENEERIEELILQINKLEVDQTNLAADVKNCCNDKKVPAILGEIFGLTINGTDEMEGGHGSLNAGDIGAWLKSYFVAKDELESRLNTLMATMQVKTEIDDGEKSAAASALTQAAVAQTTQVVMDTVLEKLRGEMVKQNAQLSEEAQFQISDQVNHQMKAAAGILGQQVLEQVQLHVQQQSQQLHEEIKSAIPEAVESAVKPAVEVAVEKSVSSSVDIAVKSAIETAVPAAVNEAVLNAVEKAVPDVVAEAVSAQIAVVVPEVVSTVVNTTVTSAVSEAMVHVSANKAGDRTIEVNQGSGSSSVNLSHEGFINGMQLSNGLNESTVIQIVNQALRKYDADKTGMVDHALETAGGNIVSTRCTESYQVHQAEVRVLGFPVYRYSTNNPRTVIQPETMPGQCWAFKGSQGYIVIQLAGHVKPTGFTLEHIPKSLSPNGAIDSAPREFEVWGLNSENDEGIFLGRFEYGEGGDPLQYFPVSVENNDYVPLVELKINSNHGNLQYTCLYRFRVHGLRLL